MFSFLSVGLHRIVLYRGNVDDDDDDGYISTIFIFQEVRLCEH